MAYTKSQGKTLGLLAPNRLARLNPRERLILNTFGLAFTKYVWNSPIDRIRWLIDSKLVTEKLQLTSTGRSVAKRFTEIHRREYIAFTSLSLDDSELLTRRLRRSSSDRLSRNEVVSFLCELRWLNMLESLGLQAHSPDTHLRYPIDSTLGGLVEHLHLVERIKGVTSTGLIAIDSDALQMHIQMGFVDSESYELTTTGKGAEQDYLRFCMQVKRVVDVRAKARSTCKCYLKSFTTASSLAGVTSLAPDDVTKQMIDRICARKYLEHLQERNSKAALLRNQLNKNADEHARKAAIQKSADQFYLVAQMLSETASNRVDKRGWLTSIDYRISESIDPTGMHYFADVKVTKSMQAVAERDSITRNVTSDSNVFQMSDYR